MSYIKKIILIFVNFFCITNVMICTSIYASEYQENSAEVTSILSEYINMYSEEIENSAYDVEELIEIIPDFSVSELMTDAANGKINFGIDKILESIFRLLMKEIYSSFKLLLLVLAISLLCSYTVNLSDGLDKNNSISKTAFYVCYMIICGISAAAFLEIIDYGQTAIENMSIFMQTIIPLILMTLVSSGALISAAVFEPVLIVTIEISAQLIKSIFVPLLVTSAAIQLVNNLSDKLKVDKLIGLINKTIKWGLGICLTVFVGVSGLQGISSGTASGMGIKISKFAAANLIPVVGGILSDSVETIMNCSLVIKNSLGVVGIAILVLISLMPLIKISASLIIFRLTAALTEPISDSKIVKCINGLADSISIMFSMVASITVMFIIILTIVINAGNIAVVMGR